MLEIKLEAELELPRVESRGQLAVVLAAGAFVKGVHRGIERVRRRFVEAVEEIEHFTDQVETELFAEMEPSLQAQVDGEEAVRLAHVASQITVDRKAGHTRRIVRVKRGRILPAA